MIETGGIRIRTNAPLPDLLPRHTQDFPDYPALHPYPPMPMRAVVFGDIHLFRFKMRPRRLLFSKRLLGMSNLVLFRKRAFDHGLLPKLVQNALDLRPDLAFFTGDVTTTSLESEFRAFRQAVRPLTEAAATSVVVPGNHDRYTYGSHRDARIERELKGLIPDAFPHTRALSDAWTLLALDPSVPQRLHARGRLGHEQFAAAAETIRHIGPDQGLVVLCHYPCAYPQGVLHAPSHDMAEDAALCKLLTHCRGRVLYLHGHIHKPWALLPGDDPNVPFATINAGAPCQTTGKHPTGQGFHSFTLPDDPHADLQIEHHVL